MKLLTGYVKPILALAFSSDGARLYSTARNQQQIWVWDAQAGTVLRKLPKQNGSFGISHLAVSPAGHLLSGGALTGVFIWPSDLGAPREPAERIQLLHPHPALALSPHGSLFAAICYARRETGTPRLQVWPLDGGARVADFTQGIEGVRALAFAHDEGPLAGAAGTQVRLWELTTLQVLAMLDHEAVIETVAFRPGGAELVVRCGGAAFVWDIKAHARRPLTGHDAPITALAYSPDGKHLASADKDSMVILRDTATYATIGKKHLDLGAIGALAWRPDSSGFAAGGEQLIALHDVAELHSSHIAQPQPRGEPLSLTGHQKKVEILAYSPDGQALASAEGRIVRLWDLAAGPSQARARATLEPHEQAQIHALSWSRDGKRLALCWPSQLHDGTTGALHRSLHTAVSDDRHLSFLPSGRLFWIDTPLGESGYVRLWLFDQASEKEIASATCPPRAGPWDYHFHVHARPDDRKVYFVYGQKSVMCWDTETGAVTKVFSQSARVGGLRVRADERQLATLAGNSTLLWSLPAGDRQAELKHPLACSGVEYLPNSRLLTSCYDGFVRVWDLSSGRELHAFDLGLGKVYCLAVAPDQMTFTAGVHKQNRIVIMDVPD